MSDKPGVSDEVSAITDYLTIIAQTGYTDQLLNEVKDLRDEDIFIDYVLQRQKKELLASLAKELASENPHKAQELLDTLSLGETATNPSISYLGDAALVVEVDRKWGKEKTDYLIQSLELINENTLREIDEVKNLSDLLYQKDKISVQKLDRVERLKGIGKYSSITKNNFLYAIKNYVDQKNEMLSRSQDEGEIPPELVDGWRCLETQDWTSLEDWIDNYTLSRDNWYIEKKLIPFVKRLVLLNKINLARKITTKLDSFQKRRAEAWITTASLKKEINIYDISNLDTDTNVSLIIAEVIATHSQSLANSYVKILAEWFIHKQHSNSILAWDLCDIALFLYEHGDKDSAIHYFKKSYQHWLQYEDEDSKDETWNEIIEQFERLEFIDQLPVIQDLIIWTSTRGSEELMLIIKLFANVLVNNLTFGQVESMLKAIKRARDWQC